MPVEKKLIGNRWRTVKAGTRQIEKTENGKPRDGGGWPNTPQGEQTAARQSAYINSPKKKKRKRK